MKLRVLTPIIFISCCLSCDPEIEPTQSFHITYGFPQSLSLLADVVTVGNLTIAVTNPSAEKTPTLLCIDETGKVQWSKALKIPSENGLVVMDLAKLDETTFVVCGNLGSGPPVIIRFNLDGDILFAKKYYGTDPFFIDNCSVNSAGTSVYTGHLYAGNQFHGFAFQEDKAGSINWAVKGPAGFMADGLTTESGVNTFLFPAVETGTGRTSILKLDNSGTLVSVSEVSKSADIFLEDVVNVGDDFYLAYSDWGSSNTYVIKVNNEGNYAGGIRLADGENPQLEAKDSKVLLAVTILGDLNVVEFDSDMTITNQKTIVNLVGGDNTTLHGIIHTSADAISCIIAPFTLDPTYADKGLNVIRFLVKDWATRCKITQSNLTSFPANFQGGAGSSSMEPFDIQTEEVTVETEVMLPNQTSICK
jgi:hypothetical protein